MIALTVINGKGLYLLLYISRVKSIPIKNVGLITGLKGLRRA